MNGLSYELAKQLKDAEFPQKHHNAECNKNDCYMIPCSASIPTLEELMEACGKNLEVLWKGWGGISWVAAPSTAYGDPINYVEGSTPTEAVAKLYIALNKKD